MTAFDLILTIINFAFGGALLFLAVTALRDNFRERLNRTTATMLFFASFAPIFWALGSVITQFPSSKSPFEQSTLYTLRYSWELFFPALLIFALEFTTRQSRRSERRALRYLLYAPQLLHVAAALVFQNADAIISMLVVDDPTGPFGSFFEDLFVKLQFGIMHASVLLGEQDKIYPSVNFVYAAVSSFLMYRSAERAFNLTHKRQGQMLAYGAAVPTVVHLAAFVAPVVFEFSLSYQLRSISLALAAGSLSILMYWSVIRYQFLNIGLAVRQSLIYTISTGALVGAFMLIFHYAHDRIEILTGGQGLALYIGLVTLALIFFQPINAQVEELIRRMFLRTRADYRSLIEDFSRETLSVFEPVKLRAIIEEHLQETLLVEHVTFSLYDDRVQEYATLPSQAFPVKYIIDRNDIFLGAIGQLDRPSLIEELSDFRENSRLADELQTRSSQLILPLKDADRLLGFVTLSEKVTGAKFMAEELNLLQVLSNQFVAALTNARLYAETVEKKRLEEEVAMARQIQIGLLPKKLPETGCYALAAHSTPSRTVGGDFYDVIPLPDEKIGIVIADASGKGMPAAMVITQIQAMIRSELNNRTSIQKALENINNYLVDLTSSEKYATLCFGIYDSVKGIFEYSNAGHNYPALVRNDGTVERLSVGGMIVGAFPGAKYEAAQIQMNHGDFIFFFTDGVTETMNLEEEEYGEDRLVEVLKEIRHETPIVVIEKILADVDAYHKADALMDDRTIVALKSMHNN